MRKLVVIGALVAALAASAANAAGQKAHMHRARAQALCPQSVIFRPDRAYAVCGGRFWIRDPQTGQIEQVSFWRLQHLNDPPGLDRP
jgi:hypothetical protein